MQELAQIMGVYYTKTLMEPEDKTSFAIRAVLYEIMKKMDDELLEKEKEQIIATYRIGKAEAKMFPELKTTGEQYYNQTYNQNK